MSITVTTDVFCDECREWIHGVTGPSVDRPGARAEARKRGWAHVKGRDLCPDHSDASHPSSPRRKNTDHGDEKPIHVVVAELRALDKEADR